MALDRIHAGDTVLREVSPCADRIWRPSEALDQPTAYTLRWESSCLDTDTDFPEQLAAVDLSALTWAAHETALVAAAGVTWFVLQDLRGDVVGLTDATGQLVETYDYDLFGARSVGDGDAVTQCTSTLAEACGSQYGNPLGYTGRPLSAVSGLYDMRARHYDPHLRQWTARDPLGYVDGFDVWGYVGGDPLNFVDPFGLFSRSQPGNDGNGGGARQNELGAISTLHGAPPSNEDKNKFRRQLSPKKAAGDAEARAIDSALSRGKQLDSANLLTEEELTQEAMCAMAQKVGVDLESCRAGTQARNQRGSSPDYSKIFDEAEKRVANDPFCPGPDCSNLSDETKKQLAGSKKIMLTPKTSGRLRPRQGYPAPMDDIHMVVEDKDGTILDPAARRVFVSKKDFLDSVFEDASDVNWTPQ